MIGLTTLTTNGRPLVAPKLNRRRALFVLAKIDEILGWEKAIDRERDTRFVELGRYLCEVRSGQYWRLDNLKSFDEFLEKRFPGSRRKAYYLMTIHEQLPRIPKLHLKQVGWSKATELVKVARRDGQQFDCATWLHRAQQLPKEEFKHEVEKHLTGKETEPWEILYFKVYKSQLAGDRASARDRRADARDRQIARLLPGDDLRRFSGGSEPGSWHGEHIVFGARSADRRSPFTAETPVARHCEERS